MSYAKRAAMEHMPPYVCLALEKAQAEAFDRCLQKIVDRAGLVPVSNYRHAEDLIEDVMDEVFEAMTPEIEEQIIEKLGGFVIDPFSGRQMATSEYIDQSLREQAFLAYHHHYDSDGNPGIRSIQMSISPSGSASVTRYKVITNE
jgi:hypothetical protein